MHFLSSIRITFRNPIGTVKSIRTSDRMRRFAIKAALKLKRDDDSSSDDSD